MPFRIAPRRVGAGLTRLPYRVKANAIAVTRYAIPTIAIHVSAVRRRRLRPHRPKRRRYDRSNERKRQQCKRDSNPVLIALGGTNSVELMQGNHLTSSRYGNRYENEHEVDKWRTERLSASLFNNQYEDEDRNDLRCGLVGGNRSRHD